MEKILNYINGELVEPLNGGYFDNYNPSNGKVYSLVPDSEKADIDHAVAAAKEAFVGTRPAPKCPKTTSLFLA